MAKILVPLSKDEADELFSKINDSLEAEFQDESKVNDGQPTVQKLPTKDSFVKTDIMESLRILEPNSLIFFQDVQVRDQRAIQSITLRSWKL